jgi:hypothetical protein
VAQVLSPNPSASKKKKKDFKLQFYDQFFLGGGDRGGDVCFALFSGLFPAFLIFFG